MVPNAEGMTIRASNPKLVADFLFPESCAYGSSVFDHNSGLGFSVNCQYAHWHFVHSRDPNHCKLAGLGVVKNGVCEPKGTNRRCLVDDSFEIDDPRCVERVGCGLQADGCERIGVLISYEDYSFPKVVSVRLEVIRQVERGPHGLTVPVVDQQASSFLRSGVE